MSGGVSAVMLGTAATETAAATAGIVGTAGGFSALTALGSAATAASIAGTGMAVVGKEQAADAASKAATANAAIATNNAKMAGATGEQNVANDQMKTRAQMGAIEAAQASKGIDISSGSASDVQKSASQIGELNALTIRSQAAQQAYGYQTSAALDTATAANASTAGDIGAAATAASGLGSIGMQYGNWANSKGIASDSYGGYGSAPAQAKAIITGS